MMRATGVVHAIPMHGEDELEGVSLLADSRLRALEEQRQREVDDVELDHVELTCVSDDVRHTVMDLYAAAKIFCIHLVTCESVLVVACAVVSTSLYFVYGLDRNGTSFSANLSWTIVSFAVVAPMIMQIKQAFARRETALDVLAEIKALSVNVLLANALWDWGADGRRGLPAGHGSTTKRLLQQMWLELAQLLLLPTLTRGRHRFTALGRQTAAKYLPVVTEHHLALVAVVKRLHEQVEVMKRAGLPANEASRINQYHYLIQARLERLLNIKFYRTPQATRSFTRLFILVLPIFYGPYYVHLVRSDGHQATNFGFCLSLSVVTSLTMIGIFNVEKAMEDPFAGQGLDGVRVHDECTQAQAMLDVCVAIEPPVAIQVTKATSG
ncbi:TPA: hypothetical protein N0F65_003292 [Lagenidium giganteum]|uniref:Uncharacterized protein n=1 Tax=Lagenidium giganteum TaxID=4803 RepID=A0AAV2YSF9_9STRA|nr:TPA: hypothetical protein N0F65_003292 [Lagenidium giganteum]